MKVRGILALFALIAVTGCFCAGRPKSTPAKKHPANPLAAEAPAPAASDALKAPPPIDGDGAAPGTGSAAANPADALASPAAYTCPHHPSALSRLSFGIAYDPPARRLFAGVEQGGSHAQDAYR